MKTTRDPLTELLENIDCGIREARRTRELRAKEGWCHSAFDKLDGAIAALVTLRDAHDRRMAEAANVEQPSPVVGSSALLCDGPEAAICPECGGVGIDDDADEAGDPDARCENCGGTGRIRYIVSRSHSSVIGRSPAALSQDLPDKPEQNQPK